MIIICLYTQYCPLWLVHVMTEAFKQSRIAHELCLHTNASHISNGGKTKTLKIRWNGKNAWFSTETHTHTIKRTTPCESTWVFMRMRNDTVTEWKEEKKTSSILRSNISSRIVVKQSTFVERCCFYWRKCIVYIIFVLFISPWSKSKQSQNQKQVWHHFGT